jgi:hypothetical protein
VIIKQKDRVIGYMTRRLTCVEMLSFVAEAGVMMSGRNLAALSSAKLDLFLAGHASRLVTQRCLGHHVSANIDKIVDEMLDTPSDSSCQKRTRALLSSLLQLPKLPHGTSELHLACSSSLSISLYIL